VYIYSTRNNTRVPKTWGQTWGIVTRSLVTISVYMAPKEHDKCVRWTEAR